MADVPDLSRIGQVRQGPVPVPPGTTVKTGAPLVAMARHVPADGQISFIAPGPIPRSAYLDFEQMIAEIQGAMRHELRRAITKAGFSAPDEESAMDFLETPCQVLGCPRPGRSRIALGMGAPDPIPVEIRCCLDHAEALMAAGEGTPQPFDTLAEAATGLDVEAVRPPPEPPAQPLVLA